MAQSNNVNLIFVYNKLNFELHLKVKKVPQVANLNVDNYGDII